MTSSWPTFYRSQGLTSQLCTQSMVSNTSSRPRAPHPCMGSLVAPERWLPLNRLASAKAEFLKMEAMGNICGSNSPWASPLHMVPKASGGWRPCNHCRRLNEVTIPGEYLVAHIHDFSVNLADTQVFSKIDLVKGYHQIPVAPKDIPKTAIITRFGLYEFLKMPSGLRTLLRPSSSLWTQSVSV